MTESEFGKGTAYCLGLFLAHAERRLCSDAQLWFNASSDHLYDLQIPSKCPKALKARLTDFKRKVLIWGHEFSTTPTQSDIAWSITEAKSLLMELDKLLGVEVIKGEYE